MPDKDNKSKRSRYNYYDNYLHINPSDDNNNHAIKFIPQEKPKRYNTRYQKRQRANEKYQKNLKAKLTPIPEQLPIDHPNYFQRQMEIAKIRRSNDEIINLSHQIQHIIKIYSFHPHYPLMMIITSMNYPMNLYNKNKQLIHIYIQSLSI